FIQIADDNLDVVAAVLDQTTNYFEHTGIQSVATQVIKRAYAEVQTEMGIPVLPSEPQPPRSLTPQDAAPVEASTMLQTVRPQLRHVQSNQAIAIPTTSVVHIGKPNNQQPPDIDLSRYPGGDIVSRRHANLWSENGVDYFVLDVGSSNGTFLNGTSMEAKQKYPLKDGDRLDFGRDQQVSLIFEMP
ncbi:MAG: FHA domain-containing protein, partial [Limnothrix sp.]